MWNINNNIVSPSSWGRLTHWNQKLWWKMLYCCYRLLMKYLVEKCNICLWLVLLIVSGDYFANKEVKILIALLMNRNGMLKYYRLLLRFPFVNCFFNKVKYLYCQQSCFNFPALDGRFEMKFVISRAWVTVGKKKIFYDYENSEIEYLFTLRNPPNTIHWKITHN